jgi:hypothetical protein
MSLEVSVISNRSFIDDPVSWLAGATTIGEIDITSVADMSAKLVNLRDAQSATTEDALIGRLNIMDHSTTSDGETVDGIRCGSDVIEVGNLAQFETNLRKIHYCMSNRGFVHLWACQIGKDEALLRGLARIFGVDVYAGTGNHNAILNFNWGDYVVCSPDGVFKTNVPRPKKVD